jgi:hypothetical protein
LHTSAHGSGNARVLKDLLERVANDVKRLASITLGFVL